MQSHYRQITHFLRNFELMAFKDCPSSRYIEEADKFLLHFPTTVWESFVHKLVFDIIVDIIYPFRGVHEYPTRAWCFLLFQRFTISFPGFSSVLFLGTLQDSGHMP